MDEVLRKALWRLLYGKRPPSHRTLLSLLAGRRSATLRDALQEVFGQYGRRLAKLAAMGQDSKWVPRAERAVRNQLVAQRAFAIRRELLPSELLSLSPQLKFQQSKLAGFAAEVKATPLASRSEAAIGARLELYSGAGRAEWFRGSEDDADDGEVVDYEALDDVSTCHPCLFAEERGPYLPGQGPFPGEVCLGRGRCRCVRRKRSDPRARRELSKS